jgi:hypothetical protein
MSILRTLGATAFALAASVSVAAAATINFSDGLKVGDTYVEKNFTFAYVGNGSVATPNDCGSDCLLLPNERDEDGPKTVRMTFKDGQAFSLLSFTFNGRDRGGENNARRIAEETTEEPALYVSRTLGGLDQLFFENLNGNAMSSSGPLSLFSNVTELFFRASNNGSARVDDLVVDTAAVPLPAAGWLMLAGLGGLAAARRRKV